MSKGKLLAVCIVWIAAAVSLAVAYRFLIYNPNRDRVFDVTGSDSQYEHNVGLALDSFSGYAVLRSPQLRHELAKKKIRLRIHDDGADYGARLQSLGSGKTPLALFTIDALIKTCSESGSLPGTIVAIVDETRGADAVVAYKDAIPNIDSLNRAEMRFVLTPDSPSETLARVVMSHFQLDNMSRQPFVEVNDAQAVYRKYRAATPDAPQAYVLWEPLVTKMLENPNTHVIADSSQFRGYIVDVLVVNRDFLVKNHDVVRDIMACYFRAVHHYRDTMVPLVLDDAKETGTPLSAKQAENLVKGVWWKNTTENLAHFGLTPQRQVQLLEDMIGNVTHVLTSTHAIENDPTNGQPSALFYDTLLAELQQSHFHPDISSETIRNEQIQLPPLTDEQWNQILPVGTLKVPKLVFARGTDRLTGSAQTTLNDLVNKLRSLPQAYVLVKGNASRRGDLAANKALAMQRALAAANYLHDAGVDNNRIRAAAGEPSGNTSVEFVLGQPPY